MQKPVYCNNAYASILPTSMLHHNHHLHFISSFPGKCGLAGSPDFFTCSIISCLIKIQIGLTYLLSAYPSSPGKEAIG